MRFSEKEEVRKVVSEKEGEGKKGHEREADSR